MHIYVFVDGESLHELSVVLGSIYHTITVGVTVGAGFVAQMLISLPFPPPPLPDRSYDGEFSSFCRTGTCSLSFQCMYPYMYVISTCSRVQIACLYLIGPIGFLTQYMLWECLLQHISKDTVCMDKDKVMMCCSVAVHKNHQISRCGPQ